jgi:hypothetical protein
VRRDDRDPPGDERPAVADRAWWISPEFETHPVVSIYDVSYDVAAGGPVPGAAMSGGSTKGVPGADDRRLRRRRRGVRRALHVARSRPLRRRVLLGGRSTSAPPSPTARTTGCCDCSR